VSITVAKQVWTGKQIKPTIGIKVGKRALMVGMDFTVTYGTNKSIGEGTAFVTGIGLYRGSRTVSFTISPSTPKVSKVTSGTKQVKVTWKKVAKAQKVSKYQVQYRVKGSSKWKSKLVKASKGSLVVKGLVVGKKYQVRVRTYKTVSGVKYYSGWSKTLTSDKVKAPAKAVRSKVNSKSKAVTPKTNTIKSGRD
jgi:hypothetical protein